MRFGSGNSKKEEKGGCDDKERRNEEVAFELNGMGVVIVGVRGRWRRAIVVVREVRNNWVRRWGCRVTVGI